MATSRPPIGGPELPDDLRAEKVFESIKGKDWAEAGPVLAKNYMHAQRLVGADKVAIPTDKSTPEEIAAFRAKIGVPAKPDEYGYKLPEGLTEDKLDKARIDTWRKELHEAGVPKAAAERIMTKYLSEEFAAGAQAKASHAKQLEQHELQIKQEFGAKFDEKVNFAQLAMREFGDEKLTQVLEETGLGSHPTVVKLFAQIGEKLADDKALGGGGGSGNSTATPALAQAALTEFSKNAEKQKALFDAYHPQHAAVVKERTDLFLAAFPKE